MPFFRFATSPAEKQIRSIVYLQNAGKWNGKQFSSTILSCKASHAEMESVLNQINHHFYLHSREYPIRWYHIMTNEALNLDSPYNGNRLGSFVRENCFVLDDVFFQGGNIFGGKKGDKYVELPEMTENHLPVKLSRKSAVVTDICAFNDNAHTCNLQKYKASVEDIRNLQHSVVKMLLLQEKHVWKDSPLNKKDQILQELTKLTKNHTSLLS